MLSALQAIADAISTLFEFLISLISGLVNMIEYVLFGLGTIMEITPKALPDSIVGVMLAFVSASVVFILVGRVK